MCLLVEWWSQRSGVDVWIESILVKWVDYSLKGDGIGLIMELLL